MGVGLVDLRKALLALMPVVMLLAWAASADASTKQETILQDDRLFGTPSTQVQALDDAKALGVDTIHSVITFRSLAPTTAMWVSALIGPKRNQF